MKFVIPVKYVIILAALLAAAHGDSINDCGDSTFINQSSLGSPKVTDCQQIQRNIAGGGTWTVILNIQRTLVTYGTCAFGVTETTGLNAKIGNQDIIDLINSSIQMFTYEGLVGSKGSMSCQGVVGGNSNVDWGLYHT